jgi:hypothetical protein
MIKHYESLLKERMTSAELYARQLKLQQAKVKYHIGGPLSQIYST